MFPTGFIFKTSIQERLQQRPAIEKYLVSERVIKKRNGNGSKFWKNLLPLSVKWEWRHLEQKRKNCPLRNKAYLKKRRRVHVGGLCCLMEILLNEKSKDGRMKESRTPWLLNPRLLEQWDWLSQGYEGFRLILSSNSWLSQHDCVSTTEPTV